MFDKTEVEKEEEDKANKVTYPNPMEASKKDIANRELIEEAIASLRQ